MHIPQKALSEVCWETTRKRTNHSALAATRLQYHLRSNASSNVLPRKAMQSGPLNQHMSVVGVQDRTCMCPFRHSTTHHVDSLPGCGACNQRQFEHTPLAPP